MLFQWSILKRKSILTSVKENCCRVFAISGLILSSLNTLLVTFYEKTGPFACSKHCKKMEGWKAKYNIKFSQPHFFWNALSVFLGMKVFSTPLHKASNMTDQQWFKNCIMVIFLWKVIYRERGEGRPPNKRRWWCTIFCFSGVNFCPSLKFCEVNFAQALNFW